MSAAGAVESTAMSTPLASPLGPVDYRPRDLVAMPRNRRPAVLVEPKQLRGVTCHYTGGTIAGYYRPGVDLVDGDARVMRAACANHNQRIDPKTGQKISDVGYNVGVGRSGTVFELRGLQYRNAANGTLPARARRDYPAGVTSSNRYWLSLFFAVGVDLGPTSEQWEAAKKIIAHIAATKAIADCRVTGHRDVRATACPGAIIYPRLGELVPGAVLPPLPPLPPSGACECAAAIARAKIERLARGAGYPGTSQAQADAVFWLQRGLNAQTPAGTKLLVVDRKFGPVTERAVVGFQRAHRLYLDGVGVVDGETWDRLYP